MADINEKRSEILSLLFTRSEKERLRTLAEEEERSMASIVRRAVKLYFRSLEEGEWPTKK